MSDLEDEIMLAEMLRDGRGLLFIGTDNGPFFTVDGGSTGQATIWVNCNDMFAPACADSEPLPADQIEAVYVAWKQYGYDGPLLWACRRRNQRPWSRVEQRMRERGEWNHEFDALPEAKR